MEQFSNLLLGLHIAAGFTGLFIGPAAMLTRKGAAWHRRWGKIFFWSLAVVAITAIVLTQIRPNMFLMLVAVFSFYSALSGYRVLYRKRPDKGPRANWFDWITALATLGAGCGLLFLGVVNPSTWALRFQPIMFVFGIFGSGLALTDIRSFVARFDPTKDKQFWWYTHMGNMLGAYIATVTAFSAVNFHFLPQVVQWLWPSAIGVPVSIIWQRYYRNKFANASAKRRASEPVSS